MRAIHERRAKRQSRRDIKHGAPAGPASEGPEAGGEEAAEASYSIDTLAAESGVPSRTIRFYQAKGVLPPPKRHGRVAVYDQAHLERLRVVSDLQDKGLTLRAIHDMLDRFGTQPAAIKDWLGVSDKLGSFAKDAPQLLDEAQLRELLSDPKPGVISRLREAGGIEMQGEGAAVRYLVTSPQLVQIAVRLEQAGIDLDTAIALYEVLEKHVRRAAEEVVELAVSRLGKGFALSDNAQDVTRAVEAMLPGAPGGDAVGVVFAREVDRALGMALKSGLKRAPRRRR